MRLIDADELIEMIEGTDELLDFQKDECIACIDACDTAYDVEKVIDEIEDLDIYFDNGDFATCGDALIVRKDVRNIVRNGGKE